MIKYRKVFVFCIGSVWDFVMPTIKTTVINEKQHFNSTTTS